jgi:dTDP-4-amino-4,6-dideoxygalactose transaminase
VQTSVHYPAIHHFSTYSGPVELPVTDAYSARTVTLPLFAHMTDAQQDLVVDGVEAAIAQALGTHGTSARTTRQ